MATLLKNLPGFIASPTDSPHIRTLKACNKIFIEQLNKFHYMFGLKSDEERLFERVDKIDAEVARMKALGFPNPMMEEFARNLRTNSYAYKGMTAQIMVEVVKSRKPALLKKWNSMWEQIQAGTLHPREEFQFYKALTGRKSIK